MLRTILLVLLAAPFAILVASTAAIALLTLWALARPDPIGPSLGCGAGEGWA